MKKKRKRTKDTDSKIRIDRGHSTADAVLPPIRVTFGERLLLQRKADKWTGGNLSKWIKYAASHFEPQTKDLEPEMADDDPMLR